MPVYRTTRTRSFIEGVSCVVVRAVYAVVPPQEEGVFFAR